MKTIILKSENLSPEGQTALKRVTASSFGLGVAANLRALTTLRDEIVRYESLAETRFGGPVEVVVKTSVSNRTLVLTRDLVNEAVGLYTTASDSLMRLSAIRLGLPAAPAWESTSGKGEDLDWESIEVVDDGIPAIAKKAGK